MAYRGGDMRWVYIHVCYIHLIFTQVVIPRVRVIFRDDEITLACRVQFVALYPPPVDITAGLSPTGGMPIQWGK